MAASGLQRLTVAAVAALCAALILPKVFLRRDSPEETAPGRFPPMMHRHVTPDLRGQRSAGVRGHGEIKGTGNGGMGTGSGPGGKSNLAAQIIPVYGFGILLYILYILFKITSKGGSKPSQSRFQSLRLENAERKINYELSQLQDRLKETEEVMENIVNKTLQNNTSPASVSLDQEQSLLQQLTAITRAMKTKHLVQDFDQDLRQDYSPETPDWENWAQTNLVAESTFWGHPHCSCLQTHEEEQTLVDQQTHEEQTLKDQQTHDEEQMLEDQQKGLKTAVEKEQRTAEDQQTHNQAVEDETLFKSPVEEEQVLEDQPTEVLVTLPSPHHVARVLVTQPRSLPRGPGPRHTALVFATWSSSSSHSPGLRHATLVLVTFADSGDILQQDFVDPGDSLREKTVSFKESKMSAMRRDQECY